MRKRPSRPPSIFVLLLLLLPLLRQQASAQQADGSPSECTRQAPPDARPIDWAHIEGLTGTFSIVLMDSFNHRPPEAYQHLELRLAPPDSAEHARYPWARLIGTLPGTESARDPMASGQPRRPSIGIAGHALFLGGFWVTDGTGGETLAPVEVSPRGFWGAWHHSRGLDVAIRPDSSDAARPAGDPAGFFCAWRTDE